MSPRLLPAGGELRRLLGTLGDVDTVVWEAGPEPGAFTSLSDSVEALLGYRAREAIDEPGFWLEHVHPDDRERVREAWSHAADGDRLDVEYRFASKDGQEVWLWHIGQVVPGTAAPHAKLRGLLVDV